MKLSGFFFIRQPADTMTFQPLFSYLNLLFLDNYIKKKNVYRYVLYICIFN